MEKHQTLELWAAEGTEVISEMLRVTLLLKLPASLGWEETQGGVSKMPQAHPLAEVLQ